jgi:hypothetical protein
MEALVCGQCGAGLEIDAQGGATCPYCHALFAPSASICPSCHHVNLEKPDFCSECGEQLNEKCPECGFSNYHGTRYCIGCGTEIDAAWRMTRGFREAYARQQSEYKRKLPSLRKIEEQQSRERLEELGDIDRQRYSEEADMAEKKKRRNLLLGVLVGIAALGFFILALIVIILDLSPK